MEKLKKALNMILYLAAIFLVLGSVLSLFRNAEIRYLKMLDFPRIQFFILIIIILIVLIMVIKKWKWYNYLITIGLLIGLIIHSVFLINYTVLVPVAVPTVENLDSSDSQFSLLMANVKMSNKKAQPLIKLISLQKPDLILAMEVDEWWYKNLNILKNDYPYSQHSINEVTYGMVLYSKFPFKETEINYFNNNQVPSFKSTITLENDKSFSLYCIHPVPPTHFKNLPDNAGQEETSLIKLGREVEEQRLPTVVAGDFNDVVWSYADELTDTKNVFYDVRVGRGFYNSYNAHNFLMKWPLDHVLVTKEFELKKLERLSKIGSDHFPIYVELVLKE
ncbi:endonuclease/exonuclease/phosphatase family protein [Aureibaculum sp. 2210JD6-5]|uniref:endonuclease/exonuclease/phosphatase family protein n=1 Tax=Aureibaculum sp. 2210JD6-5 TaxID=3103957 RepID=UPI002AAC8117|nr:endonuclease/exonuclease/phosphatase family protein [Aureibaculum sp. 2210JD6-5]MDY7394981.1 endonuclease/exonuclease/phosphatase family protein [Aureibaculum sp. 2210JD6-5]